MGSIWDTGKPCGRPPGRGRPARMTEPKTEARAKDRSIPSVIFETIHPLLTKWMQTF